MNAAFTCTDPETGIVTCDGTVVVAAPSVVVGSLVCTLSIDLGSLRNARVAVHATDGVAGSVSGSPTVRLGKQSGLIQIAVLRGSYDVQATLKGNRFVIDGIDCTGPTGTASFPS